MKRKDDDLLRLAFGELSDEATRAVESRADASDRAEIAAFRRLREGLDALPTPPPDGLSTERLRAAILDRELRGRRRPFAWGGLLVAPAALAALAAVVMLPRLRPHAEPQLVGMDDARSEILKAPTDFGFKSRVARNEAMSASAALPKVLPTPARAKPIEEVEVHRAKRHRRSPVAEPQEARGRDLLAYNSVPDDESGGSFAPASASASTLTAAKRPEPETIAAPPSAVVEAKPGQGGKTQTVVLVSSQRDLETGAPAATEKEAASVLVGG